MAGTDEIKFWIMSWGSKALTLESESLRDEIRTETKVMLDKYGKDTEKEEKPPDSMISGIPSKIN